MVMVMNLQLLESFGQNYPQEYDGVLDCISRAVTCQFNRSGSLLAVGCNDGRVFVWDFLTRGIAKIIAAHVYPVCCLSWSRYGHKLVSACTDNVVAVWHVLSGECEHKYRFPMPVLKIQVHPRNDNFLLVCLLKHLPVTVTIDAVGNKNASSEAQPVNGMNTQPEDKQSGATDCTEQSQSGTRVAKSSTDGGVITCTTNLGSCHRVLPADEDADSNVVAVFDHRGQHILMGNSKGRVTVLSFEKLEPIVSFRIGSTSTCTIKTIEYSRRGDHFLVNSVDRIIRVFDMKSVLAAATSQPNTEILPSQKLQDQVNRTMWKKCCFSGDAEYVCGGSARQHDLYIWERSTGTLVKILQGTKGELLLDVMWHPVRPIVASVSAGVVAIWSQNQVENWSAFAPDFKELDENVEYEERESEFDFSDEDAPRDEVHARNKHATDELTAAPSGCDSAVVDIETIEPIAALCSSDEDGVVTSAKHLDYLPIAPEVEEPEETGAWEEQGDKEEAGGRKRQTRASGQLPGTDQVPVDEIALENAVANEVHPLLSTNKQVGRRAGKKKTNALSASSDRGKGDSKKR